MELSGRVRILDAAQAGIWRVMATASDLGLLGEPHSRSPGRSILGLKEYEMSQNGDFLSFQLDAAAVLNLGTSNECIAIAFEVSEKEGGIRYNGPQAAMPGRTIPNPAQNFGSGDDAFIAACRSEQLPESIIRLVQSFLEKVREFSDDTLSEGKHRKWVTNPKNFLALTIQNRNQEFCVHVKETPLLTSLSDVLDIRKDRPPYVRFKLRNERQLEAAVRAAKSSFGV